MLDLDQHHEGGNLTDAISLWVGLHNTPKEYDCVEDTSSCSSLLPFYHISDETRRDIWCLGREVSVTYSTCILRCDCTIHSLAVCLCVTLLFTDMTTMTTSSLLYSSQK